MAEATEAFRLEVDGWDLENDAASESGPAKRRKLSLSLNRKEPCSTERFVFLDNAKAEALNKRYVPKNTEKSTQWALSTFRSWRDKRNDHFREEADKQVPADLLASTDHAFKLVSPTKSFRRGQVIVYGWTAAI